MALYPFQAIESGDISLEKVRRFILFFVFGIPCTVPGFRTLFNLWFFAFRAKNTKWWTILKSIGGKFVISLGKFNSNWKTNIKYFKICLFCDIFSGIGYIPSNYVKEKEFIGLQKYEYETKN